MKEVPAIPYNIKGGYVYILKTESSVKIGVSKNTDRRIFEIEHTSGKKILDTFISEPCLNYHRIEADLHSKFKEKRILGEWFDIEFDDAVEELKKIRV